MVGLETKKKEKKKKKRARKIAFVVRSEDDSGVSCEAAENECGRAPAKIEIRRRRAKRRLGLERGGASSSTPGQRSWRARLEDS
jgi:hypothetical protein